MAHIKKSTSTLFEERRGVLPLKRFRTSSSFLFINDLIFT